MHKPLVLVFLLGLLYGCRPGENSLAFKARPGQQNNFTASTEGQVAITVAGKTISTNISSETAALLLFDTLGSDLYNVTLRYTGFKGKQRLDSLDVTYDPNNPIESEINLPDSLMQRLEAVPFTMRMDAQGKVVEIGKNDTLLKTFARAVGLDAGGDSIAERMLDAMKPLMNEQMTKGLVEQAFFVFPDRLVNLGDEWTNTMDLNSIFSMRIASAYKLTQITDSTATLEVTSEIRPGNSEVLMTGLARAAAPFTQNKLANSKKGIDLAGIKMTVEFTGSQTGTVTIDRTRHRVSHCTMHQLVTGDLKIGIFMLPMNMDMVWRYNISDRPSRWEKLR